MARFIPASERVSKARILVTEARDFPKPADATFLDLSYVANVKDLLQKARDFIKFIPYRPGATPELKEEVARLFDEIDQTEKELLHRH